VTTDKAPPPHEDAQALRNLADDLTQDALKTAPATPQESGVTEGLGRAVGKAHERARQLEQEHYSDSSPNETA
jgi:hypothetical protein